MNTKTQDIKEISIKNIDCTTQGLCKCGNWLQHWFNYSGQKAYTCKAKGCVNTDIEGVHVQKSVAYDKNWYIVPLCEVHKQHEGNLELEKGTYLVSAHKSLTCG